MDACPGDSLPVFLSEQFLVLCCFKINDVLEFVSSNICLMLPMFYYIGRLKQEKTIKLLTNEHKCITKLGKDMEKLMSFNPAKCYRKRGKIRWAKLSRIPPTEVFHGKTFTVPYIYNTYYTKLV